MQLWDAAWWHTIWTWVSPTISATVLAGLVSWYGSIRANKIQERYKASLTADIERQKADLMQQLERVKGEVHVAAEKNLHMQKAQFDIEFKIYQELWSKLRAVQVALQRASFYKAQAEQTSQDWAERRSQFDTAVRALAEVAEDQRPFFAARIARDLFDLLELANQGLEITETERSRQMQSAGPQRRSVSPKVTRNLDAIEHAGDRLCESIRERVTGTENAIE